MIFALSYFFQLDSTINLAHEIVSRMVASLILGLAFLFFAIIHGYFIYKPKREKKKQKVEVSPNFAYFRLNSARFRARGFALFIVGFIIIVGFSTLPLITGILITIIWFALAFYEWQKFEVMSGVMAFYLLLGILFVLLTGFKTNWFIDIFNIVANNIAICFA